MTDRPSPCPDCGYVAHGKTDKLAANAMRRHSCELHRERLARADRVAARATTSGPKAPCTHLDDSGNEKHPHGDRLRYVRDRCRCRACREANTAYERAARRQKVYGRGTPSGLVDAQPVREHVRALQASGMGLKAITAAAGLTGGGTIERLIYGRCGRPPAARVSPRVAEALLSVRPRVADGALVAACGTRLRLRALHAIGWSITALCEQAGIGHRAATLIIDGTSRRVTGRTASTVRDLYEREWQARREGWIADRARNHAAKLGCLPPMALDDDRLDDPGYVPDVTAIGGERVSKVEQIIDLVDLGYDSADIATHLHARPTQIRSALRRSPNALARLEDADRRSEFGRWTA